ncbi:hypothetical protein M8I35_14855 [Micromonospora sp. MSM11]|nr:hypothetical protein [Micromonospora sp. MSM11]MCL7458460.1 hypothetical protein [Micromonospora sp. MSM11]
MTEPSTGTDSSRRRRGLTPGEKTGAAIGLASLLVAVLAWQWPRQGQDPRPTPPPSPSRVSSSATAPVTTPASTGNVEPGRTYLDALTPETGAGYLRPLPRTLADRTDLPHPVVLSCPTNDGEDRSRSVSYPLKRRYLDFSATFQAWYPPGQDPESAVRISAVVTVRQPDDTLTRQPRPGRTTTMSRPAESLSFSVEGADLLTLTVECDLGEGLAVLSDAGLTR